MHVRTNQALLSVVLIALLAGCGQKGALYLPSQKKAKVPATTTAAPPASTAPESAPAEQAAPDSGAH